MVKADRKTISRHTRRLWRRYVAILAVLAAMSQGATNVAWVRDRVLRSSPAIASMSGELNIAVTEFRASATGQDNDRVERTAADLAESIAQHLDDDLSSIVGDAFDIEFRSPEDVGRLSGSSREEIATDAYERADQFAASVLVDGELSQVADTVELKLSLYFLPSILPGAEELAGAYELGTVAEVVGDVTTQPVVRKAVREDALSKVASLVGLIAGIGHYSRNELADAGRYLDAVALQGDQALPEGGALLHLMRGNVALKLERFDDAETEYGIALAGRAGYARAYIGLAEATFLRAIGTGDCSAGGIDVGGTNAAIELYRIAGQASYQPPMSDVAHKVNFGLGRALWCLSSAGVTNEWEAAETHFQRVIRAYDRGNDRIRELAAESHGGRGLLTLTRSDVTAPDYRRAQQSYEAAISLTRRHDRQGVFTGFLAGVQAHLGDVSAAVASYERAAVLDPANGAEYLAQRDMLGTEVPQ
jgi:tetratricopeptide (TPR) repeat protein